MKFLSISLAALFAAATTVAALPAPGDDGPAVVDIFPHTPGSDDEKHALAKRGYGCKVIGSDDEGICNFHCRNNVKINCGNGYYLRPTKGECGGFASAVCQCHYDEVCP